MSLYPGLSENIAYVLVSRNWTFGVRTFRVRTFGVCPQPECPSETNRNTSGKWILSWILSSCVGDLWEPPSLPLLLCPVFEFLSRFVQSSANPAHWIILTPSHSQAGQCRFLGLSSLAFPAEYTLGTFWVRSPPWPWNRVFFIGNWVSPRPFADLTDVTLADEDTNSILIDNANRAFVTNFGTNAMHVTSPAYITAIFLKIIAQVFAVFLAMP